MRVYMVIFYCRSTCKGKLLGRVQWQERWKDRAKEQSKACSSCMFLRLYLFPGKVGANAAYNYWSNHGSVHQVPITAGWTEEYKVEYKVFLTLLHDKHLESTSRPSDLESNAHIAMWSTTASSVVFCPKWWRVNFSVLHPNKSVIAQNQPFN